MTTDFLIGHIIQFHSVETCLSTRVPHNYLSNTDWQVDSCSTWRGRQNKKQNYLDRADLHLMFLQCERSAVSKKISI